MERLCSPCYCSPQCIASLSPFNTGVLKRSLSIPILHLRRSARLPRDHGRTRFCEPGLGLYDGRRLLQSPTAALLVPPCSNVDPTLLDRFDHHWTRNRYIHLCWVQVSEVRETKVQSQRFRDAHYHSRNVNLDVAKREGPRHSCSSTYNHRACLPTVTEIIRCVFHG
jgi:hypothetical protein